jgi:HEAT repeats/PBS lyase HEAT-like repeat
VPAKGRDATARAAAAATDPDWSQLAGLVRTDPDPRVRAIALAALVRTAPRPTSRPVWEAAARDPDARVRLRAAEIAPHLGRSATASVLLELLESRDAWVAEAAAYALGERPRASRRIVDALIAAITHHDPLVREAAVAALGAVGDPRAVDAVLRACDDRPAIRRRAVIALAAFDGERVEQRLRAALDDTDWQTRQAAEDVLDASARPPDYS